LEFASAATFDYSLADHRRSILGLAIPLASMDIALELCDTFFFDYLYSTVLPARPAPYGLKEGFGNSTIHDLKAVSPWQFTPASQYLSWKPRDVAWMSQLTRDNPYRQFISLLLITW
jgi:lathosterol oxidase